MWFRKKTVDPIKSSDTDNSYQMLALAEIMTSLQKRVGKLENAIDALNGAPPRNNDEGVPPPSGWAKEESKKSLQRWVKLANETPSDKRVLFGDVCVHDLTREELLGYAYAAFNSLKEQHDRHEETLEKIATIREARRSHGW